ncbi:DUF5615 family PIN-like protein [Candidatus Woesearchaeota archaeon]|nr:DUF5615 family PIN-like protein [Candidatus Woesearchaeota archaeon]
MKRFFHRLPAADTKAGNMKFLIDTNLGRKFTSLLKQAGHDAIFAKDLLPLRSDEEILAKAKNEGRIVVTNDKDFGELVFRLGRPSCGVILLRVSTIDPKERFELAKGVLDKAEGGFVVVKEGQARIRRLK